MKRKDFDKLNKQDQREVLNLLAFKKKLVTSGRSIGRPQSVVGLRRLTITK